MISAVVLAGGTASGELATLAQTDIKALVPMVGGRTLLEIVLSALRDSGLVDEIVVVGDVGALRPLFAANAVRIVPGGATHRRMSNSVCTPCARQRTMTRAFCSARRTCLF